MRQTFTKTCPKCGKEFTTKPTYPQKRHCSVQCANTKHLTPPTFVCAGCGKVAERRRFKMKSGKRLGFDYSNKFCSKECGWKHRKWRPISEEGYVTTDTGYVRVHFRNGVKRFKHQVVMEQMLGRPLRKGENIHHKDGNRTNNKPSNLELWSKKQPPGQRVIDKVVFALEILRLYPEFVSAAEVMLETKEH